MSYIVSASNQGTLGVQPATVDVPVRNAGAVDTIEIGDLVRFDMTQASSIPGQGSAANASASNSKFANVLRDAAATIATAFGIYGVAIERISAGKIGKVRVVGIATVKCASNTYTAGETIGISSSPVSATVTNSNVQIGLGTVLTTAAGATSVEVIFDGSMGMSSSGSVGLIQNGVYGSTLASTFIRDAVSGTDSVDILTIGDSNMGYEESGYSAGFRYALSMHGVNQYATCLAPFADSSTGNNRAGGNFTEYFQFKWAGVTDYPGTNGNGKIANLAAAVTASDTAAIALSNAVGGTNFANLKPNAFQYDAMFIRLGGSAPTYVTSPGNGPALVCSAGNAFAVGTGGGGTALQYRVVYGTFATGAGQFKLQVVNPSNGVVARSASAITTNTGTVGIAAGSSAATLNFTSPEVSDDTVSFACNVDGFSAGTTADYPIGPCAMFWHSLAFRNTKGFAVTNFSYYSGRTTQQLASDISSNSVLLRATLKELRQRQTASGGSGRVMVYLNSGINDGATASTYTTHLATFVTAVKAAWSAESFPANDLAILITSTHPTPNSIGGEPWYGNRPQFNSNAQSWVVSQTNVTYVDFGAYRSAQQMLDANLYSFAKLGPVGNEGPFLPYAVHLRSNPTSYAAGWRSTNGKEWVPDASAMPGGSTGWEHPGSIPNNGYYVLSNFLIRNLLA
jgi:hypothetical protein